MTDYVRENIKEIAFLYFNKRCSLKEAIDIIKNRENKEKNKNDRKY